MEAETQNKWLPYAVIVVVLCLAGFVGWYYFPEEDNTSKVAQQREGKWHGMVSSDQVFDRAGKVSDWVWAYLSSKDAEGLTAIFAIMLAGYLLPLVFRILGFILKILRWMIAPIWLILRGFRRKKRGFWDR